MFTLFIYQLAAFSGAAGQVFYKLGSKEKKMINYKIIIGICFYFLVIIFFAFAYISGGSISVLYPSYATTFIWAVVFGKFVFKEKISIKKITGIAVIIGGIYFVTL